MKVLTGFTAEDYSFDGGDAWVRILCAPLPDESCGLLLLQHHKSPVSEYFDYSTELNVGFVTGASQETALSRITTGANHIPIPAAYRRLNRLLCNGEMQETILDTLAERGLIKAIAYTDSDLDSRMVMFDRAGWQREERQDKTIRYINLED